MNIALLGAAGFIGTNLTIALSENKDDHITVIDQNKNYFSDIKRQNLSNVKYIESDLTSDTDYERLIAGQNIIYHLISTTVPTTSNQHISEELKANVILSSRLFEACVKEQVNKVVFISSGGTVYGKESKCPLNEKTPTKPITSYGVQKITIEKLLYLYSYMYGLDYRIIRLSNPYGPYQRPNGILGAVSTFTYQALKHGQIEIYGDGSVVRDFIYIDDAVRGIITIVDGENKHRTFNLGSGFGTSIKDVVDTIANTLQVELQVKYTKARKVDVPVNYLDIGRYEKAYGPLSPIPLSEGIKKTAEFMKKKYKV